jgi:hypothetical protein
MDKRPISLANLRRVPPQFSWLDQRLVRDHYIDRLSPQACALYRFLGTVADAQGLSYDADPSLCQRLSLTSTELHQARQALLTQGLVAYQRPLYQVLGDFRERCYCARVSVLNAPRARGSPPSFRRSYCGHARFDAGIPAISSSVSDR